MIFTFAIAAAVVALDQLSKLRCAAWLPKLPGGTYKIWDGILHLKYVENRGAAFGMLQGGKWFFLVVTALACALMIWFLIRERKRMHALMRFAFALLLAGAVGNLIDRVLLGYVRDMIYVAAINFAVFNVADMAVCIGCGLLVIDVFFLKKGKRFLDELERGVRTEKNGQDGEKTGS